MERSGWSEMKWREVVGRGERMEGNDQWNVLMGSSSILGVLPPIPRHSCRAFCEIYHIGHCKFGSHSSSIDIEFILRIPLITSPCRLMPRPISPHSISHKYLCYSGNVLSATAHSISFGTTHLDDNYRSNLTNIDLHYPPSSLHFISRTIALPPFHSLTSPRLASCWYSRLLPFAPSRPLTCSTSPQSSLLSPPLIHMAPPPLDPLLHPPPSLISVDPHPCLLVSSSLFLFSLLSPLLTLLYLIAAFFCFLTLASSPLSCHLPH